MAWAAPERRMPAQGYRENHDENVLAHHQRTEEGHQRREHGDQMLRSSADSCSVPHATRST
jgi:hypothetical protein